MANALPCQTVKACAGCRALLGGVVLADREALPNSALARGFDHPPTRPPNGRVPFASPVALTVKALARSWSLAHGALVNRLALPDSEGLRRSIVPCLVAVCWQIVKPWSIPALLSGLIEVPALPVASITLQPDRQGMGSFRLALLPCKSNKPG